MTIHFLLFLFALLTASVYGQFDLLQEENAQYKLYTFTNQLERFASDATKPTDIVFVLDESGSVGVVNFESFKKFTELIGRYFTITPNKARAAAVTFGTDPYLKFNFITSANGDMCNFLAQVSSIIYGGGATNTGAGLEMAGHILNAGRTNAHKIIVLLSDGATNHGNILPIPHSAHLKSKGTIIFCVGVAGAVESELLAISSGSQYMYLIKDFQFILRVNEELIQDNVISDFVAQTSQICKDVCDANAACYCGSDGTYACACNKGFVGSGRKGKCTRCHKGSYMDRIGQNDCIPCPYHSVTQREGATSISECFCPVGFQGDPQNSIPCRAQECPILRAPSSGHLEPRSCGNAFGDECSFWCEKPYCPYNGSEPNCLKNKSGKKQKPRKCLVTGKWSGEEFHCEKARCPPLKTPENGIFQCDSKNLEINTKCTFSCSEGFHVRPKDVNIKRVCQTNVTWSGAKNLKCKPARCNPLKKSAKFKIKPESCVTQHQFYNTQCQLFCEDGYSLVRLAESPDIGIKTVGLRVCGYHGWKFREEKVKCKDSIPPTISCPQPITTTTEFRKSVSKPIYYEMPKVNDNDGLTPRINLIEPSFKKSKGNIKPGYRFPIGKTKLVYQAKDYQSLTASCSFHIEVLDKEPPTVVECPENIEKFTSVAGPINIEWDEPIFNDNSRKAVKKQPSHKSGTKFPVGKQVEIVYTATDNSNNKATCKFKIVAKPYQCDFRPTPVNSQLDCQSLPRTTRLCKISCNPGFDFAHSKIDTEFKCEIIGGIGVWNPDKDWPKCSKAEVPKVSGSTVQISSEKDCSHSEDQEELVELLKQSLCAGVKDCDITNLKVACNPGSNRRRKRDEQGSGSILTVDFEIKTSANETEQDVNKRIATSVKQVADKKGVDAKVTKNVTMSCKTGQVFVNAQCVNCPLGEYFKDKKCHPCPLDTYQDQEAATQCNRCPNNSFTSNTGSINITSCLEVCQPGSYSKTGLAQCTACAKGYYQNLAKQTRCKKCPDGTTTWAEGIDTEDKCSAPCPPGSVSSTGFQPCNLCPRGSYQAESGKSECIACSGDLYTVSEGMKDASSCIEIDLCKPNPCQRNGNCSVKDNYDTECNCVDGIAGPFCEINIDDCYSTACFNNGSCVDGINDFTCKCQPGFSGSRCEDDVDDCVEGACLNGGTCQDGVNSFGCACPKGFAGKLCEIPLNDCDSNPCINGGRCQDLAQGFMCCCKPGFSGYFCEIRENDCVNSNPCRNAGICKATTDGYVCTCSNDFSGVNCEIDIDSCASQPCQNNGICKDKPHGYECQCKFGYDGSNCEKPLTSDFEIEFATADTSNHAILETKRDMMSLTISFWMKAFKDPNQRATPVSFSYRSRNNDQIFGNALTLYNTNKLDIYIQDKKIRTVIRPSDNSGWTHYVLTWNSYDGKYDFYINGSNVIRGTNIGKGIPLNPGFFVLGQEQDFLAGGFSSSESFIGSISQFNVWDFSMTEDDIRSIAKNCGYIGNVVAWPNVKKVVAGDSIKIKESQFCTQNGLRFCGESEKECNCLQNPLQNENFCNRKLNRCDQFSCQNNQKCTVIDGINYCQCDAGFSGRFCEYDINECLENNGNCSHDCQNSVGSYKCLCPSGFVLTEDERTCIPTNRCEYKGELHNEGTSWVEKCENCTCQKGRVTCFVPKCPEVQCKNGFLVQFPAECCPKCFSNQQKRCVVQADDMYESFDGHKIEKFTATCSYVLARDCADGYVSVHIQNAMLQTARKRLVIYSLCEKVEITEDGKVIVNNQNVSMPHESGLIHVDGDKMSKIPRLINVVVHRGIVIQWTAVGRIFVAVSDDLKNKMCGLCGNYNGDKRDDMLLKNYVQAKTLTEFVHSWQVDCPKKPEYHIKGLPKIKKTGFCSRVSSTVWERARQTCSALRNEPFHDCYQKVDPQDDFNGCLQSVCACKDQYCHCSAIENYVFQCKKAGLVFKQWEEKSTCEKRCTNGKIFQICSSRCEQSCSGRAVCRTDACKPGCSCPKNMFFHRGHCISRTQCPRRATI